MSYYLAPSLKQATRDFGIAFPRRGTSDGWIGDASHQASKSDHNPDYSAGGVVRAIDVDVHVGELAGRGWEVAEAARAHPSVQYVIFQGKIWNRSRDAEGWRRYTGSNPHNHHVHISLRHTRSAETSTVRWVLRGGAATGGSAKPAPASAAYGPFAKGAKLGSRVLRKGSAGDDVTVLQRLLGVRDDGYLGDATVQAIIKAQKAHKLEADGIAGPKTVAALTAKPAPAPKPAVPAKPAPKPAPKPTKLPLPASARWTRGNRPLKRGDKGSGVGKWQSRMKARGWRITVDESFGPATEKVVRQFQAEKRLPVTGQIDQRTWEAAWTEPVK